MAIDIVRVDRGMGGREPLALVPWFHAVPVPEDPWTMRLTRLTQAQTLAQPALSQGHPALYYARAYVVGPKAEPSA